MTLIDRRAYPAWICSACGFKHGVVSVGHCATYHMGDACGWCGRDDVPVTEPRDYGYPPTLQASEARE